jgi:hypothetical protein
LTESLKQFRQFSATINTPSALIATIALGQTSFMTQIKLDNELEQVGQLAVSSEMGLPMERVWSLGSVKDAIGNHFRLATESGC